MSTSNPPPLSAPPLAAPAPPAPAASSAAPTFPPPPARINNDEEEDDDEDMGAVPPAAAVRLSVMRRLWAATNELQGLRRLRLAFFGVAGLAQVVAFIVILAGHYTDECDSPLGAYLIMVIVRILFAYPPYFWLTISPPRPPARRDSDETRAAIDRNRHVGTLAIDHRVRRLSDLVSVYALVLFIMGNVWVAGARTCSATAPTLYKGALAALILSWIYIAEVLVWSLLIIFALPFLLIGMRWFGVGQAKNEIGPLKKEDIASLPQRIFIGTLPEDAPPGPAESASTDAPSVPAAAPGSDTATPAATSSTARTARRRQFWRLWRRRAKSPSSSSAPGGSSAAQMGDFPPFPVGALPLRLPESQAACAICLCEYDPPPLRGTAEAEGWEPELLGLLPCGHAFHAACLGDWLVVSGRCPLCQRDLHAPKKKRKTRARGGGGGGADGGGEGGAPPPGSAGGAGAPGGPGAEERV